MTLYVCVYVDIYIYVYGIGVALERSFIVRFIV